MDVTAAPRRRRVHWADVACLGGLVTGWIYYLAIIPLIPSLIGTHPVLLEALSGSLPAQIAAGAFARIGRASLAVALAAPIVGMMAFDPFWWWAGRRYGSAVTEKLATQSPRTARGVMRGRRLFDRFGGWTLVFAYYLLVPNTVLYALAGWAGFGLLRFVLLDLVGTMLYTTVGVALGYSLGSRAAHVAGLISRYSILATVALVAALIAVGWWRNRRSRRTTEPAATDGGQDPGGAAAQPRAQGRNEPGHGPAGPATVDAGQDPGNTGPHVTTQRRNEHGHGPAEPVTMDAGQDPGGTGPHVTTQRRNEHGHAGPVTVDAGREPDCSAAAQAEERLRPLVADGTVPGLVYAVVTPGGTATGQVSRSGGQPLGPHVMLEIGSLTKVFTALLLADSAERGEVQLDAPIARHLPPALAQCPAARITFRQLATHTSGLPRLPRNLLPMALLHPGDPYARYSAKHLYRAVRRAGGAAPAEYLYSNFGFGLLGDLLSRAAGRPYADLLADRIAGPLGLTETGVGVPAGHVAATGHRRGRPVPPWHLGALAGAGALSSTASDLARFLTANLAPETTPLRSPIETTQAIETTQTVETTEAIKTTQRAAAGQRTGLGWHIASPGGRHILWHNGATGGFSAMLALDRQAGCAVAAVATASPTPGQPLDGAVLATLTALTALTGAETSAEAAF